jgi:hypothetical protein
VGEMLEDMQQRRVIEESGIPWSCPVFLLMIKNGELLFCVYYIKLNDMTRKDDTLDTLAGFKWFSTLDIQSYYLLVALHPANREKGTFTMSGYGD